MDEVIPGSFGSQVREILLQHGVQGRNKVDFWKRIALKARGMSSTGRNRITLTVAKFAQGGDMFGNGPEKPLGNVSKLPNRYVGGVEFASREFRVMRLVQT